MKLTIKQIVDKNYVRFVEYRKGILYYNVVVIGNGLPEDECGLYRFPVPIEDCGDATFQNHDKAIYFMRYIRKAVEDGTFVKI
jgi:hypothetical protein